MMSKYLYIYMSSMWTNLLVKTLVIFFFLFIMPMMMDLLYFKIFQTLNAPTVSSVELQSKWFKNWVTYWDVFVGMDPDIWAKMVADKEAARLESEYLEGWSDMGTYYWAAAITIAMFVAQDWNFYLLHGLYLKNEYLMDGETHLLTDTFLIDVTKLHSPYKWENNDTLEDTMIEYMSFWWHDFTRWHFMYYKEIFPLKDNRGPHTKFYF